MTGVLLNSLYIVSCAEGIHRIGVPQIVETVRFQSCFDQYLLEHFPDRRLREMPPVRVGKHKIGE